MLPGFFKKTTKMASKNCSYILRTMRHLPDFLLGRNISKCTGNYRPPILSDNHALYSKLATRTVPIRCLGQETSTCLEAKNGTPDWTDGLSNDPHGISDASNVGFLNADTNSKAEEMASHYTKTTLQSATMAALNKCTSPRQVLNVFSRPSNRKDELYEGVMKLWHTYLPLTEKQKLIERELIIDHPHFYNLTSGVIKVAPVMTPGALVRTLYVFVRLKVNQQAWLVQNLLRVCQERLSIFNEVELAILANSLENLKSDKNVDMLKFGLRLLIDVKIGEVNGVIPLLTMMRALGRTAPLNLKLKLENKALQMVDKFTVAQSSKVFCVLSDINFYSEHLLNACSLKILDGLDELTYKNILSLLSCCYELQYYNEKILKAVGDQILKTICIWKPWQVSMILQYLAHLSFRHVPLLDRYAEIVMNSISSLRIWDLSVATRVYAMLNHIPKNKGRQFLEALSTALEMHLNDIPPRELLYIVFNLCILGVHPQQAINKILQNHKEKEQNGIIKHINLCLMLEYFSECSSLQQLRKVPAAISGDIQTFHTALQTFIKDPNLYQYSLQIANAYYIDFMLALDRQENKLLPVGDIQTDSLLIAGSSDNIVRIAILCCTPNAFAFGTVHPLGRLALKIRHIKSLGLSVLVVPVHRFVRMSDDQRLEFMKTNIFKASSDNRNAECSLPHDT